MGKKAPNFWKILAHESTLGSGDFFTTMETVRRMIYFEDGLKGTAQASNQLLREYVNDPNKGPKLLNANVISIDFPDEETVKAIIDVNFMYL